MKILKGCGLALLCFILFFSLVCFGIGYTVNRVALNPEFISKTIDDIDLSQTIEETLTDPDSNIDISADLQTTIIDAVRKTEPIIKEHMALAIKDSYAYLKGKTNTPDLKSALSDSIMNSEFVPELLENIDISQLFNEAIQEQTVTSGDFSEAFTNSSLVNAIDKLEPSLKQQIVNLSDPVFKYLLMQTSSIDLRTTVRQTILSTDFITEVVNNIDVTSLVRDTLTEQIGTRLPDDIQLSDQEIDNLVAVAEPYFNQKLTGAAGNIADYLVGIKQNFSVNLSLDQAVSNLKSVAKEAYMSQLPAYLQGLPQSTIDQAFESYYADFRQTLPSSVTVDSSDLGTDLPGQITDMLNDAQTGLTDARNSIDEASRDLEDNIKTIRFYINIFNIVFIAVIALIVLLILGIILIHRTVKGACRDIGIVFFIYGGIMFAGLLIAKTIIRHQLFPKLTDIPQSLQYLPGTLLNHAALPLLTVSLVCLIMGILLIVASILYPRLRTRKTA